MYNMSPSYVETYHLRLLLLHIKGATSFEDLRTINGVTYVPYAEACLAAGLIATDDEWNNAIEEAYQWMMPNQLRNLFRRILIHCNPNEPNELWEKFKINLSEDHICEIDSETEGIKKTYKTIKYTLSSNNYSGSFDDPFLNMLLSNDVSEENSGLHSIEYETHKGQEMYENLNGEQKGFVDDILQGVTDEDIENKCFFIEGFGGSGKTYFYITLYHLLRGNNKRVCTTAFTGIAATLLPGGKTIHKTFGLSVPLYPGSNLNIKAQSKEAEILRNNDLFLVDEAPTAYKWVYDIMDKFLRDTTNNPDKPFGVKAAVLGGDFRQILPIQENATRSELVSLSLKFSTIWSNFKVCTLRKNMRTLLSETEFSEFLLKVVNGELNDNDDNVSLSYIPKNCISHDIDNIEEDTFGDILKNERYRNIKNIAILSCRNEDVDEINKKAVELLDEEMEMVYTSIDSTENCENGEINQNIIPEFLHTLNPTSLPSHEIKLRKWTVIMFIRHFNIEEGLCNGTRLLVLDMTTNVIKCEVSTGDKAGEIVFINRITLYSENDYPFTFKRRQFPIRVAFAMTINKSQGQTFEKISLDLRRQIFSHGQLYVAMSQVRSWQSLKIHLFEETCSLKNHLFKELYIYKNFTE